MDAGVQKKIMAGERLQLGPRASAADWTAGPFLAVGPRAAVLEPRGAESAQRVPVRVHRKVRCFDILIFDERRTKFCFKQQVFLSSFSTLLSFPFAPPGCLPPTGAAVTCSPTPTLTSFGLLSGLTPVSAHFFFVSAPPFVLIRWHKSPPDHMFRPLQNTLLSLLIALPPPPL